MNDKIKEQIGFYKFVLGFLLASAIAVFGWIYRAHFIVGLEFLTLEVIFLFALIIFCAIFFIKIFKLIKKL